MATSTKTPIDKWRTHAGDPASYTLELPARFSTATDWRLEFRHIRLPNPGPFVAMTPDISGLGNDPPTVVFRVTPGTFQSIHDGWTGDIQCSLGTQLTIELTVEDDWTV